MDLADRIKRWRGQSRQEEEETEVDLLVEAEDRLRHLEKLCSDLVGEETLHQDGAYETEMATLRTDRANARADAVAAAGELMVDIAEAPPGSTMAKVLIANKLIRNQRDRLRAALADVPTTQMRANREGAMEMLCLGCDRLVDACRELRRDCWAAEVIATQRFTA